MQNKIIIFTSPSGAGKTTIVRHLLSIHSTRMAFSISATTRKIREGEEHGVHYYYLSHDEFKRKRDDGHFLEWEEVYEGLYYGTLKSEVDRLATEGKHLILDIDVNGAQRIKKEYGDRVLTVFVKPPSPEVLIERLTKRGTESPDEFEKRIARMRFELEQEAYFDKVIVNDVLEVALKEAEAIVNSFLEVTPNNTQ